MTFLLPERRESRRCKSGRCHFSSNNFISNRMWKIKRGKHCWLKLTIKSEGNVRLNQHSPYADLQSLWFLVHWISIVWIKIQFESVNSQYERRKIISLSASFAPPHKNKCQNAFVTNGTFLHVEPCPPPDIWNNGTTEARSDIPKHIFPSLVQRTRYITPSDANSVGDTCFRQEQREERARNQRELLAEFSRHNTV